MKRWFFTHHINYNTVSIFETAEYGPNQGYLTKNEAVIAAIESISRDIFEWTGTISRLSNSMTKLMEARIKLMKELEPNG